ncbi:MAG: MFS transporter [Actinomycetota bacterium]
MNEADVPGGAAVPSRSLFGWLHPAVVAPAVLALSAGFAQFVATATLADVAVAFGVSGAGEAQVGLSGTTLGIGLAIIRFGSLATLPLTSGADRFGRRTPVLIWTTLGLLLTATAALATSFWWFVAILAFARPLLSATNAVTLVIASEVTKTKERSGAVALVGAAYALGAGLTVLLRAVGGERMGFRALFALAAVPLLLVILAARRLEEPKLFDSVPTTTRRSHRLLAPLPAQFRQRLILLCLLTAGAAFVTGPANTFVFFFAETTRGVSTGVMAIAVLAAGPIGLAGLIAGRWTADNLGRRASCATALAFVSAAAIATYNVGGYGVVIGYLSAMFAAAVYTPASGAISTELFPTSYRSTAAGWLIASGVLGAVAGLALFGFLADRLGGLGTAATCMALPVIALSFLYLRLPETRGQELEESAPELAAPPQS